MAPTKQRGIYLGHSPVRAMVGSMIDDDLGLRANRFSVGNTRRMTWTASIDLRERAHGRAGFSGQC